MSIFQEDPQEEKLTIEPLPSINCPGSVIQPEPLIQRIPEALPGKQPGLMQLPQSGIPELGNMECFRAAREPLPDLVDRAKASSAGIFILPSLFPEAGKNLVGCDGGGHYTISRELGNPLSFGELAATITRQGKTLGLTVPLQCSREHPFRIKAPEAFHTDGTPRLDSSNWHFHRKNWEAVFRYWIVQGIDIFELSQTGKFSQVFWQKLIGSLRDDFPGTVLTSLDNSDPDLQPGLPGVGFPESDTRAANIQTGPSNGMTDSAGTQKEKTLGCSSSNPLLSASIRRNADGELLLRVSNEDPSSTQSGHIHLFGTIPELQESEHYHMHNLTDGRSCHWIGTTNFVLIKAGEAARTLRIARTH